MNVRRHHDRRLCRSIITAPTHLNRPQPALLALLASGWSPVYPCHIPAAQEPLHPIGTGPFKFAAHVG